MSVQRRPAPRFRLLPAIALAAGSLLAAASPASALTIGQLSTGSDSPCAADMDWVQPTVTSGTAYAVPARYHRIVDWRTGALGYPNQSLTFKVFRPAGAAYTYKVVAHDGPRRIQEGQLNKFKVDIKARPGDLIGLHTVTDRYKCDFLAQETEYTRSGNLADGKIGGPFSASSGYRLNVAAKVGTGKRATALNKCKKKHSAEARKKCKKRAQKQPV